MMLGINQQFTQRIKEYNLHPAQPKIDGFSKFDVTLAASERKEILLSSGVVTEGQYSARSNISVRGALGVRFYLRVVSGDTSSDTVVSLNSAPRDIVTSTQVGEAGDVRVYLILTNTTGDTKDVTVRLHSTTKLVEQC